MFHAVLLLWKFLANANSVYGLYLIGFKADDPATYGTYRLLPVNVIDAWQLSGLSNDMTRRVKTLIERSLKQAFVKNKAFFHMKCLSKYVGALLKRLQVDLTEEVSLFSIQIYLLTALSSRTSELFLTPLI